MRGLYFTQSANLQLQQWSESDKVIYNKIKELLKSILEDPFKGIGKPEPLKNQLKGCWSRRINKVHRLVYKVNDNEIIVISCKFHY